MVTARRRFHYPGFSTRVRLLDHATGHMLDFNDPELAERLAESLDAGVDDLPPPALKQYAVVRSPRRGKLWLRRTPSSVASYIVGICDDEELARRAVAILNRLDPAQLAPARINWLWF